jgi:uncharacterized membrane protein
VRALSRESSGWLMPAIAILCVLGIGVAGYLTYVHYAGIKVLCIASGGCETVQSSSYAKVVGIPVALLGLIGYITILASLAVPGENGRMLTCAVGVLGCAFSLYLTYRELFTIKAICQWCVASAVLMTLLAILSTVRMLRADYSSG